MSIEIVDLDEKQQQELTTNKRRFTMKTVLTDEQQKEVSTFLFHLERYGDVQFGDEGKLKSVVVSNTWDDLTYKIDVGDEWNITKEDITQGLTKEEYDALFATYQNYVWERVVSSDLNEGVYECSFINLLPRFLLPQ